MNTLEIPHTKKRYYLPSSLAECDGRQYSEMAHLLFKLDAGQLDYSTFRVHALYAFLNMKPVVNKDKEVQDQKAANIYQLSHLVDDFFEDMDGTPVLRQYYTNNHNPLISLFGKKYQGPKDNFDNVAFGQYVDGLNFFQEYTNTKEPEFLYLLMATFYVKKKQSVEKLAEALKNYDFGTVYGFYLFFASFQKYLVSSKIYYNAKELDLSVLFDADGATDTTSDLPGLGLKSTMYTLAESGVFGSLKQVRKENLWEVMLRMYDIVKRDKDYLARQKKLENN